MRPLAVAIAMLALASSTFAQSKQTENTLKLDGPPGKGTLADAAFLVGHWSGPGLGGTCEEVWVPPLAGSSEMMGMFRFVRDGKTQFTEHFVLVPDGESLTLRLRHFDPAFNGWEEKDRPVAFKLIRVEKDALYFGGLTFRKTADGGLDAFVAIRRNDKLTEASFKYRPHKPTGR
jgi:hypothetical protein